MSPQSHGWVNEEGEALETGLECGHQGWGPSSEKSQHQTAPSFRRPCWSLALLCPYSPRSLPSGGGTFSSQAHSEIKSLQENVHKIAYNCYEGPFLKIRDLVSIMKMLVNIMKIQFCHLLRIIPAF